jgi:hypothetical protein
MSTSNVLRLNDYRDRRSQRLRLAESLHRASPQRLALLGHVAEVCTITGADRAAVVWVDEYGPGIVHAHVVLDQLADRPRRVFPPEPLKRAWELGVPGALDEPGSTGTTNQSTLAVALGSDGTRAWFMISESVGPRAPLDSEARDRIMFLCGECSAVVLHRELDASPGVGSESDVEASDRFGGWPILKDLGGQDRDGLDGKKISQRFVIARLARMLVEDDLALPADRLGEQVARARREISAIVDEVGREGQLWLGVLDACEASRLDDLAKALVELGEAVEQQGHHNGALEFYRCAYDIAASIGLPLEAIDAARFSGRVYRRLAGWEESMRWYSLARGIGEAAGADSRTALVLVGLAEIQRGRGNLPGVREQLAVALPVAVRGDDAEALATVYASLLSLEQSSGDHRKALEFGWLAVRVP